MTDERKALETTQDEEENIVGATETQAERKTERDLPKTTKTKEGPNSTTATLEEKKALIRKGKPE